MNLERILNGDMFTLFGNCKLEHYRPKIIIDPKTQHITKNKFKHFNVYDLLDIQHFKNGITNEGKNLILNVMFNDTTQIANASWFIGLINNSGFSALAAADVMNSHAGWTEFTDYTQATRVAWGSGTSTAQSTTNATPATFDINATGTVYGIFVTSVSTKTGTTGKLWSTASFTSPVAVSSGDQLKISYSVSC